MTVNEKYKDQYTKVSTNDNAEKTEIQALPAAYGYGIRHLQMLITFICICIIFIARAHLSVTVVAMTSQKHVKSTENILDNEIMNGTRTLGENYTIGEVTTRLNDTVESMQDDTKWTIYRTYDWSKPIQETVLSSFFLGYCLMNIPMGLVCQRWGGKVPIQIALLINGLVSLFTPWLTLWGGWKALSLSRVAQGLTQAGTFPGIQTLLASWVPISERATMSSYVYAGSTIGNIIGFQLSGFLADTSWGWPSTYWAIGVLCITCFVFLTIFGSANPMVHKTITEEERNYIIGQINADAPQRRIPAPLKSILTSKPAWANFCAHTGSGVAYVFILSQVPSFIHYIRGIDVKNSGILSSLPYMASFFATLAFGLMSDYLTNRKILSVKTARRVFSSISSVGVAVMLIGASFANSTALTVICFVLATACYTSLHSGWMLNHIDLSPRYSGTLMAIGNTLMNLFVVVMPMLVSNIVIDVRNPYQWRIMLSIIAGLVFFTNIVFVFFLSVEVQPWDEGKVDEAEIEDAKHENTTSDTEVKK